VYTYAVAHQMAERARVAAEVEGLVQRRALIDELQARAEALAEDEDAWRVCTSIT
jgi:hypothetical protein